MDRPQQPQVEVYSHEESYQGPVPPPDMLRDYDYIVPGAARMIIDTAVSQTAHRQAQEAKVISGSERRADRGQHYGLALLLIGMIFGLAIALAVSPLVGAGVITAALASGAVVYVVGGRPPKEEPPSQRGELRPGDQAGT